MCPILQLYCRPGQLLYLSNTPPCAAPASPPSWLWIRIATGIWKLPRLPFQLLSSLFSSRMGVLLRVEEWDSKPEPALEMDMRDLAGLMEESCSVLPGSLRERCCSTLIMASFSMIWACRVLILWGKEKEQFKCLPSPWAEASVWLLITTPWLWLGLPMALGEVEEGCQEIVLGTGCFLAHRADHVRYTHPPLATGNCSKQPWKELWNKPEKNMRPTESINTFWGVCTGGLTPGKTALWAC